MLKHLTDHAFPDGDIPRQPDNDLSCMAAHSASSSIGVRNAASVLSAGSPIVKHRMMRTQGRRGRDKQQTMMLYCNARTRLVCSRRKAQLWPQGYRIKIARVPDGLNP
jgi:hypothetical protein